jgi:WD40 repeat protein
VHVKQITEIIEITVPKLIASTSLDGKIKLWDLYERMFISDLKDPSPHSKHNRGIRGATYSYDYGGNLLTFGFENYVNVWCPEISKTRAFIGKLEGHSTIIVACKFIPGSPNVISIDDKTNIRIWDIRTLATIQILSSEQ